jgi:single-stranded DNA-specific DHH superfamily exonuclease
VLTQKQIKQIKEHLDKAHNPVFFFDNDQDGLCSFLLLQRYIGKGKGVPIKSFSGLTAEYFKRIEEFNSDYIFILDKPLVSEEFFEKVSQINIPVVWIDHHVVEKKIFLPMVDYYNPYFNKKSGTEPVTALCYQVTKKKNDLWLAVAGCIADKLIPKFYSEFRKKYPDLSIESLDAFEIYYKSLIGKVARMFGFGLKDKTTNVMTMLRFLSSAKTPYDVLEESSKNHAMHYKFNFIEGKSRKFLKKAIALEKKSEKILFFQYGGDLSISSELSNELSYLFPKKIIIVVYISGGKTNISIRGKNVLRILAKTLEGLENATGGGHDEAVGARIQTEDLEKFRESFFKIAEGK